VGMLGADLEEEAHAVTRDGDLEVTVLLVAAGVGPEGDPRIVRRVHRAARADLGHARLETLQVEDPEIACDERWGRHRCSPRAQRTTDSSGVESIGFI